MHQDLQYRQVIFQMMLEQLCDPDKFETWSSICDMDHMLKPPEDWIPKQMLLLGF